MMPDQDSFWDELLAYIEAHSVIPIVGPELVVVENDGRLEPYHQLLARELATRLKVGELGEGATLDQVVGAYLAKPGSRRQSVYRELGDIAAKLTVKIPEPLLQLASIRDLNLFASFCTDNLLAQAINAVRFGGRAETRELAFNPSEAGDLPDGSRDVPVVYGLFGRLSVLPKYVIAEEDELEWVTALQIPEKRPERLFDELGHNHSALSRLPVSRLAGAFHSAHGQEQQAIGGARLLRVPDRRRCGFEFAAGLVPDQLQPRNRGAAGGPD